MKDPVLYPADPKKRDEPLPSQFRKALEEDPEAYDRIEQILQSKSYIIAEKDEAFLQEYDTLGIRLELDYQKAELLLQKHGIDHTIVVFGSTHIVEEETAKRKLLAAQEALAIGHDSPLLQKKVTIAENLLHKSRYYTIAREFGQLVGQAGTGAQDCRLTLMTGGGPGIMEAANRGAFDVGAKSIGLNISLPNEQYPNPYITPDLCFQFHYFAIRKLHFLQRAKGLVVFPGGFGTIDELFDALTLIQTRKIDPIPIVLVGQAYWEHLLDLDFLEVEGTISSEDKLLFWYAESAKEAWEGLLRWHDLNKTPLF